MNNIISAKLPPWIAIPTTASTRVNRLKLKSAEFDGIDYDLALNYLDETKGFTQQLLPLTLTTRRS
jgi:hypothetical protein